jgi:hypothetical protein
MRERIKRSNSTGTPDMKSEQSKSKARSVTQGSMKHSLRQFELASLEGEEAALVGRR